MFGYVRPVLEKLSPEEQDRFQSVYCGLCHALGQNYGPWARLILNYDFTFLALVLMEGEGCTASFRCPCKRFCRKTRVEDAPALRLAADAGDEEYGALSVRARTVYDEEILRMVPPQLFHPKPEVDSCVLRMRKRTDLPPMEFRTKLSQVARLAFSQRRKKMIKQLASVFGRGHVEAAYREIGLPEDIRAERVTVEQFQKLTHFFQTVNSSEE